MVRFRRPPAEGKTQTLASSIGASLCERAEQIVDISIGEATALILDLEQYPLGASAYSRSVSISADIAAGCCRRLG